MEVDFILGEGAVSIEIKLGDKVRLSQLKGLIAFRDEKQATRSIVVCQNPQKQHLSISSGAQIEVFPWELFLKDLWAGNIIA